MSKTHGGSRTKNARPRYKFIVQKRWLTMPDGVRLAATLYMPCPRRAGERFPVLLEYLPYRKDDTFYVVDYPTYSYFARHGFITVKVDIRGTGASGGAVPEREYSDIELSDGEVIIAQLAEMPESSGNVAMWGTSWSGFNSLQMAMRRPPALKTIIAIHASDDLYHDDIHYTDGVMHLDPYHLFINHELGLPRTPDYTIDKQYLEGRFQTEPWAFKYLTNQVDGDFWRPKSLRFNYDAIDIPVYLIGGLLDGYRTATVRMFENLKVPVKLELGPWNHSCPDDGSPAPNHEWMDAAIVWLKHWLGVKQDNFLSNNGNQKQMAVFVRSGQEPNAELETTAGQWRLLEWPLAHNRRSLQLYPQAGKRLGYRCQRSYRDELTYKPGSGTAAGHWWGDTTGDMAADDGQSLVYDSQPVRRKVEIVGCPKVTLKVASTSARCNWSVRLEDVSPDGKVALITGALCNSSQRDDRLLPSPTMADEPYKLAVDLQFTTWTFKPGHKIRLSISNAQFPMAWPSAEVMTTELFTGSDTVLCLPEVKGQAGKRLRLPSVQAKLDCPDGDSIELPANQPEFARHWHFDPQSGTTAYVIKSNSAYRIKQRRFLVKSRNLWKTVDGKPWDSKYLGTMSTTITSRRRSIKLATTISIRSDKGHFHVRIERNLCVDGRRIARKVWRQSIPRQFQ